MFSATTNARAQKIRTAMACLHRENPKGARRLISSVGFSMFSLSAKDVESLAVVSEDSEIETRGLALGFFCTSQNPFLALGLFCMAVLYALARKEKATSDATIEFMKIKLKEKEVAITSLQKKFELEKEFGNEQLQKLRKENQSLADQFDQAIIFIDELDAELESLQIKDYRATEENKELREKLKVKHESSLLSGVIISFMGLKIEDNEEKIRNLSSILAKRERSLNELSYSYLQSQETVEKWRNEASDFAKQLQQTRDLCSKLEARISNIQAKFAEKLSGKEPVVILKQIWKRLLNHLTR